MNKRVAALVSFFSPLCMAANPATIAGVDAAAARLQTQSDASPAILQAQIDALNHLPAVGLMCDRHIGS